jgi:hypothetical protein
MIVSEEPSRWANDEGERMVASDIVPMEKGNVPATDQLMDTLALSLIRKK